MTWETEFLPKKEFMQKALELAKMASEQGEIPVGAVVEKDGAIIGTGFNQCEKLHSPLAHAEIIAINMACENLGTWRLDNCNIYVSLEPCAMCTGALINSRIKRVIFAAHEDKSGCCGSLTDLTKIHSLHKAKIYRGFMESEAKLILKEFFRKIRNK